MDWKTSEKMLLKVLSAFANGEERADFGTLSPTFSDWGDLFCIADEQKILPVVYEMSYATPQMAAFRAEESDGVNVGERVFEKIRKTAIRAVGQQAYRSELFLNQYEQLTGENVEAVVVKGIVVRDLYKNGDHRPSADEDLWVRDEDFLKAVSIFLREGYVSSDEVKETCQELGFRRADGSYIELHRKLFSESQAACRESESLLDMAYERRQRVTLSSGKEVWTLSPQDHFLYLILHAYKHFIGPGVGIRQVMDIGVFGRKFAEAIDWQKLYEDLKSIRAEYFAAALFWICEAMLSIPLRISDVWKELDVNGEPLLLDLLGAGLCGNSSMERQHTATITLNQVEADRTNKKRGLWETIFPPKRYLISDYPELKTKPWRLLIVWAKRIFKYLKETKTQENNDTMETLRLGKERTELLRMYKIID